MKRQFLIFIAIFTFFWNNVYGQVVSEEQKALKNYMEVNPTTAMSGFSLISKYPMYPNGIDGVNELFRKNIKYPTKAKRKKMEDEVVVQYTIDVDGNVKNIKVIKSAHKILDNEVIRVLKLMDLWEPAYQRGKPVIFTLTQSFTFRL
jgi:TonB family protein